MTTIDARQEMPPSAPRAGTADRGVPEILLYEILARARMREAEAAARRHQLARRLVARRRWQRLARYAAERADRASQLA